MTTPHGNPGAPVPNPAYAVPSETEENGYRDIPLGSFASPLRASPESTPDPLRIQNRVGDQYRPPADKPPEQWWSRVYHEYTHRHSVETLDADGWEERKGGSGKPAVPRERAGEEPRPTTRMAPSTYSFTRPWDQGYARRMNGMHFSMADHRHNYQIGGMAPTHSRRNTYRLDPVPWDVDIVDLPPHEPPLPSGRIRAIEVPLSATSRSWRL